MAYRRRQGNPRPATYEEVRSEDPPSLAAQAIMASSAHRDSSLSSAYAESAFSSRHPPPPPVVTTDSNVYEYTSIKNLNEPNEPTKSGFWGVIARKAKSIIDDDASQHHPAHNFNMFMPANPNMCPDSQHQNLHQSSQSFEGPKKSDGSGIHKRLDAFANSLNYIGGKVGNALEEGLSVVENRTADIIQETRKLNIRRKGSGPDIQNQGTVDALGQHKVTQIQNDHETQLKASRDVANAMAAKAKMLLRELKTVKADLAFAKARCSQLEEENKILRESRDKQGHPEDDDLIRLQLETLLAEKSRLAHENSVYARENQFLREIVEYHQLTMQDVVYFDEGSEEVTEVYPMQVTTLSTPATPRSPSPTVLSQQTSTSTLPSPRPSSLPPQEVPTVPFPQVSNGDATVSENVDACHEDVEDKKTQHSSA